jgi:hypothetical protein
MVRKNAKQLLGDLWGLVEDGVMTKRVTFAKNGKPFVRIRPALAARMGRNP